MALPADAAAWLASTSLSYAMRRQPWLYPIVEIVHIVGFAVLVGGVVLFDLRVLGFGRSIALQPLGRHLLPWSFGSLLLVVPAGLMMFSAQPQELIHNPAFLLKLTLIAAAGLNALLFHAGVYRAAQRWGTEGPAPPLARFQALLSVLLWVAVICCGRLLAYV
jgi:hypothetical protein